MHDKQGKLTTSQDKGFSALDPGRVAGQGMPCHAPRVMGGGPSVGVAGDQLSEAPLVLPNPSAWAGF